MLSNGGFPHGESTVTTIPLLSPASGRRNAQKYLPIAMLVAIVVASLVGDIVNIASILMSCILEGFPTVRK